MSHQTAPPTSGGLSAPDRPTQTVGRFAALEGYRGLAALLIVIFHVYQYDRSGFPVTVYPYAGTLVDTVLRNLDSMVDLFFVLSAFLLGLPFARAVLGDASDQAGRGFVLRRTIRIVPVYLVAVTVVWASRNTVFPGDWRDLLEHLTFTSTFDPKRIFYTIGPAWSLAVEVQFYLLLAVIGVGAQRLAKHLPSRNARAALLLAGVGTLAAVSIGFKYFFTQISPRPSTDWPYWFSLPAKLDVFACGLLLAVVCAVGGRIDAAAARWVLRLSAVIVVAVAFVLRVPNSRDTWFHGACAIGFALLLASHVLSKPGRPSVVLNQPPLLFLGLISYSLYLWHEPVLLWLAGHGLIPAASAGAFPVTALVVATVSVAIGTVSFYGLEKPTQLISKAFDRRGRAVDYYTHLPQVRPQKEANRR
jgi:peptidoglycan/LPS O-acetylase OafA/YrhL